MKDTLKEEVIKNISSIEHVLIGNTIPEIVHKRKSTLKQFANTAIPNSKMPFWRYAQCERLFNQNYQLLSKHLDETEWLEKTHARFKESLLLFFVNGVLCEHYCSNVENTPVSIKTFEQLEQKQPQLLNELLLSSLHKENIFSLMNFLLLSQGVLIIVPSHFKSTKPIVIINYIANDKTPAMHHSQLHLVVEKNAQAQVLEYQYISGKVTSLTNFETNIRCDDESTLEYNYISQNSTKSNHVSHRLINQYHHSECTTNDLLIGGKYHRHQCYYYLHSEKTKTKTTGLMLPVKNGVHDLVTCLEHHFAHAMSSQRIKSLIPDYGHASFTGNIQVNKDAQNTDAKMECRHLMLGTLGKADSSPQFEIFTDDVQCNHGATITELNENELFYLESRAIPNDHAKKLLTQSFITEWINGPDQILSNFCRELINEQCNKIFRGL